MRDIAFDIRQELFRVQPKLSAQRGEHLVQDIPRCFRPKSGVLGALLVIGQI